MNLWLLVPVKSFRHGKSRLAPTLGDVERLALNRYLLNHIISVAHEFPGIGRTAVVSDCDDVLKHVENIGALAIRQHDAGMNAAVSEGTQMLRNLTDDLIVLPSDLPKVQASDVRQFYSVDRAHRVALCADRWERGTNGILLRDVAAFDFAFGEDSFALHWRQAADSGANPYRYFNPNIAFDIDVPADLKLWTGRNQIPNSSHVRDDEVAAGPT